MCCLYSSVYLPLEITQHTDIIVIINSKYILLYKQHVDCSKIYPSFISIVLSPEKIQYTKMFADMRRVYSVL